MNSNLGKVNQPKCLKLKQETKFSPHQVISLKDLTFYKHIGQSLAQEIPSSEIFKIVLSELSPNLAMILVPDFFLTRMVVTIYPLEGLNKRLIKCRSTLIISMVGHSFQNYHTIYVRFFFPRILAIIPASRYTRVFLPRVLAFFPALWGFHSQIYDHFLSNSRLEFLNLIIYTPARFLNSS